MVQNASIDICNQYNIYITNNYNKLLYTITSCDPTQYCITIMNYEISEIAAIDTNAEAYISFALSLSVTTVDHDKYYIVCVTITVYISLLFY